MIIDVKTAFEQYELFDNKVFYNLVIKEFQYQFMVVYNDEILSYDDNWLGEAFYAFERLSHWYFEEYSLIYLRIGPTKNKYFNSLPKFEIPEDYFSSLMIFEFSYEQLHGRIIQSQSMEFNY